MAIQTQTVTGRLSRADGEPVSGIVRFTLNRYEATSNGIVTASEPVDAPVFADGSIALTLWPNVAGLKGTRYSVALIDNRGRKLEDYGFIRVGVDGPYSLADLLLVDEPPAATSYWTKLTQEEFDTKIAAMDVRVSVAEAARDIATDARDDAVNARDAAAGSANAAYANAQDVASALVYQDLAGIAASKGITVFSGFVYDTTKDSDGGAWRHRCQGKTWYIEDNVPTGRYLGEFAGGVPEVIEAGGVDGDYFMASGSKNFFRLEGTNPIQVFRGARREFPAVAIVIAESSKVTIFDGDDPALPMWMVFVPGETKSIYQSSAGRDITGVAMKNARLAMGRKTGSSVGGLIVIDFLYDQSALVNNANHYAVVDGLVNRNNETGSGSVPPRNLGVNGTILGRDVKAVDIEVMQDAPVNPVTGLKMPTIGVALAGGLSFAQNDGSTTRREEQSESMETVAMKFLGEDGSYMYAHSWSPGHDGRTVFVPGDKLSDESVLGYNVEQYQSWETAILGRQKYSPFLEDDENLNYMLSNPFDPNGTTRHIAKGISGSDRGVTHMSVDPSNPSGSMVAYAAHNFATGWLVRSCKGCWLSSTDATALTDETISVSTPNTKVQGEAFILNGAVEGEAYLLKYTVGSSDYTGDLFTGMTRGVKESIIFDKTPGTHEYYITAHAASIQMALGGSGTHTGSITLNSYSVQIVDPDRSVMGEGLTPHGTITKTPVATGSDLVAYSGFSSANYLEQLHNPALDFGTGDFFAMGWWKDDQSAGSSIFSRSDVTEQNNYGPQSFGLIVTDTFIRAFIGDPGQLDYTTTIGTGRWRQLALIRRNQVLELWLDGFVVAMRENSIDVSNSNSVLRFGQRYYLGSWGTVGQPATLALWRMGSYAPTSEQMIKMYRDEKRLFKSGAGCKMHGNSRVVTALSYDDDKGLKIAGTSGGLSRFDGLVRVSQDDAPITTVIASGAGYEVTQ